MNDLFLFTSSAVCLFIYGQISGLWMIMSPLTQMQCRNERSHKSPILLHLLVAKGRSK